MPDIDGKYGITAYEKGRTGNKMFIFALSKIISLNSGHSINIVKNRYISLPEFGFDVNYTSPGNSYETSVNIGGNLKSILNIPKNKNVILNGFYQNKNLYCDRVLMRKIFNISVKKTENTIVHVRLGDYVKSGFLLDFAYYKSAINKINPESFIIITDEPNHPYLDNFKSIGIPYEISGSNPFEDFMMMVNAKNIVISESTFSWWGAHLSDSDIVVCPECDIGWWSKHKINLICDYFTTIKSRYFNSAYRCLKYIICI